MDHEPVLISTIAIGLTAAFIGGLVARRLGLPAIVGYIVAGVVIGPFTPGLVADPTIATELAEIGVILLMFGVGIHFSLRDLLAVRGDRDPGRARARSSSRRSSGSGSASRSAGASAAGSCSGSRSRSRARSSCCARSTDRGELDTPQGRIAVGWLIVEDLVHGRRPRAAPDDRAAPRRRPTADREPTAPARARRASPSPSARRRSSPSLMIVAGARLVPWLLLLVAREGSRELFTLAVLAIALGIAFVVVDGLRRVVRARRVPGRRRRRRVGHEPPGRGRRAAAARRLRRAVLRVGRDAPRPGVPRSPMPLADRWPCWS